MKRASMKPKQQHKILRAVLQLCLVCAMAVPLSTVAQMLDSIDIERADGMAVIKITLSHNIRYRGHFPQNRGSILNIYFDNVSLENDNNPTPNPNPMNPGSSMPSAGMQDMQRDEYMRSPPNDLVPFFWVAHLRTTSGDSGLGGFYLSVQFSESVNFSVRADEDNRAFYIYVPIAQHQDNTSGPATPAPVKGGRGAAPVMPSSPPGLPPATTPTPAPMPGGEPTVTPGAPATGNPS